MSLQKILYSLFAIFMVGGITFIMRAFPFIMYKNRKPPKIVLYFGSILPPAVIAMLVVYCFKSITPAVFPFGLPELIAAASVVALHIWKRNNLISILGGTAIYMILVQTLFA